MYKTNYYNFYIPVEEENETLLYNSLFNKLFVIEEAIGKQLIRWSNQSVIPDSELNLLTQRIKKSLINEEYIIPTTTDEKKIVFQRLMNYKSLNDKGISLTILPTNSCNMKCVYCFEDARKKKGIMNAKTQKDLLTFVQEVVDSNNLKFNDLSVTWFGGEPLLATSIIESLSKKLLTFCKENSLSYRGDLITNGVNLTVSSWDLLKKAEIKTAQVTIDGNEGLHNMNRPLKSGENSYHIIMKNLSLLPEDFSIRIRINVDREVFSHIEELFDDLETYKIWPQKANQIKIYLGFKQSYDRNFDNKSKYFSINEHSMAEEELRRIKYKRYNQWAEKSNRKKCKMVFSYPKMNSSICKSVNSSTAFVIDCHGNILKCWDDCTYEHKALSNITRSYKELKNNKSYKDMLNFSSFKYSSECNNCKFLPICDIGNCFHRQTDKSQVKPCTSWRFKLIDVLKDQYLLFMRSPDIIQSINDLFNEQNKKKDANRSH